MDPLRPDFSGFVFKLQANMDPATDRVAFVRVCSGRFEKNMTVRHARTGKAIRLSRPQKPFGQDWPLWKMPTLAGCDWPQQSRHVLDWGHPLHRNESGYEGIPASALRSSVGCAPESFRLQEFRKGVNELREEGMQILYDTDESKRDPISWRLVSCSLKWCNTASKRIWR